ncbi:DivIVA domain-containing protein [Desulfofalx alkaliphila]|uniref:DivIVA domain-containing protein n=1 Tax=Desulfofalx alkaliphila TaxID=105483 RepID=UPI00068EF1F4|nr:DivIVA domain-containing protein [Desulfofalx alkaliphila]
MLTPLDIRQMEFKKNFRGYDERQVDKFMEEVADAMEELLRQNHHLQQSLADSETRHEKYRDIEEAIKNTLVIAQKNAQDMKETADKEIKVMMRDAMQRAENIIQQAEEEGKKIIADAQAQAEEIEKKYREIQKQAEVFRTQFRTFLEVQLDLINNEDLAQKKLLEEETNDQTNEQEEAV